MDLSTYEDLGNMGILVARKYSIHIFQQRYDETALCCGGDGYYSSAGVFCGYSVRIDRKYAG